MQSTAKDLLLELTSANAGLHTLPQLMAEQPGPDSNAAPPAPGKLAEAFEEKKCLRRRAKDEEHPHMTRWINRQATNVPSVKAMALNYTALELLAEWWCSTISYPKAVPIDLIRREVGGCSMLYGLSLGHLFLILDFGPL